MRLRLAALLLLACAPAAHAQLAPTDGALGVLALFGLAPQYARDHGQYTFNVTTPAGHTLETSLFRGLPGVPETVDVGAWGVRPTVWLQGWLVGLNASVQLDFTSREEPAPDLTFERSFGVTIRYHSGLNLTGLFAEDPLFMVTVGPLLDVSIGPRLRLEHADGSHAQWGRLGDLQFAPSVGVALIRGPVRLYALGAQYREGAPWTVLNVSAGEASGRFDAADPDSPVYDPDYESVKESLQRVVSSGGYTLEAGASVMLTPEIGLSATLFRNQRDYRVQQDEGGRAFGVTDGFTQTDMRWMLGLSLTLSGEVLRGEQ